MYLTKRRIVMGSHNVVSDKLMSKEEAAYVAGFIDGEGSIYMVKERRPENCSGFRYGTGLVVSQCHLGSLEAIRSMTRNGRIISEKKRMSHHKDIWKLSWTPNQMRHILPQLLPYLIVKHRQAVLALQMLSLVEGTNNYGKNNTKEQHEIYEQIRALNKRGLDGPIAPFQEIRQFVVRRPSQPTCSIEGCQEKHYGKGLCRTHYREEYEYPGRCLPKRNIFCSVCGLEIPKERKSESIYCSRKCQSKADHLRRKARIAA
jgi:hypothetical protein